MAINYLFDLEGSEIVLVAFIFLLLALIPAGIAKTRGHTFLGYYMFGFCLFPFSLAVALLLPDKKDMYENGLNENRKMLLPVNDSTLKNSEKEKITYVRNFYTNIPLRPYHAKVYTNDNGNIIHSIFVNTYGKAKVDCIRAMIKDYDIFENILYEKSFTTANLKKSENGFSFISVIDSDSIEYDVINYLEVYIESYAFKQNIVKFEEPQQCTHVISTRELIELKYKYGEDAVSPFEKHEDHWICVCGGKCENNKPCPVCERSFGEENHLQAFLYALTQLSNVREIKNRFICLKGILSDDKFDRILNYLEKRASMAYGMGDLGNKEKYYLKELISE